jgi:RNA polymerase sigma-70 factor (ECF subfamily)
VFFKLYRGFESYDPERELRPWVFAVATNQVRDHWRSRTNRETVSSEVVEADLGVSSADLERDEPGGELERRELAASLRHAVDLLPDAMRMAVLLRVYEGLSFQAIGAALECEEATARKRYSRALEKLRSLVGTAALREEASG